MKASKFTEAQIAFVLKQAETGTPIAEVCRSSRGQQTIQWIDCPLNDATFYNWRKKYAGLMPSEMKRLRQLEEGEADKRMIQRIIRLPNAKLKRIVADLSLDKAMLQDELSKKLVRPLPRTDGVRGLTLPASASLLTRCVVTGRCRSGEPARP